eukprot:12884791-Prorocentrum_lima.AAC.1
MGGKKGKKAISPRARPRASMPCGSFKGPGSNSGKKRANRLWLEMQITVDLQFMKLGPHIV